MYLKLSVLALFVIGIASALNDTLFSSKIVKKFILQTNSKTTWHRALHLCLSQGGQLASVASKEENDEILKLIKKSGIEGDFWISGTRLGNNPNFYWMGHEDIRFEDFSDFAPNEPNGLNSNEHCVELRNQFGHKWNDNWCDYPNYFICEEKQLQDTLPGQHSLHDFLDLRAAVQ